MKVLAKAAVTVVSLGMIAVAAPANAMTTTSGAYSQTTYPLSCTGHVQGDGDGGTLSVAVSGNETRPSDRHFRTWKVKTYAVAQEKTYSGAWVDVAKSGTVKGSLGPSVSNDEGTINTAAFTWGGSTRPTFTLEVGGFDDLFRAKVVTRVYDDEWVLLKILVTYQGQCRL